MKKKELANILNLDFPFRISNLKTEEKKKN